MGLKELFNRGTKIKLSKKFINRSFYFSLAGAIFSIPFILQDKGILWTIGGVWNAILTVVFWRMRKRTRDE